MRGGVERVALRQIAAQPWKNGAGLTREIAVAPATASTADFDWRISLADVTRDAPFSAFPGIDRCIVLLRGEGLRLRFDDRERRLDEPLEPFAFSGDESVHAELIGGPSVDFNVMVRRGRWRASVTRDAQASAADAGVLLCAQGCVDMRSSDDRQATLHADEALLWRDAMPALHLRPTSPDSRWLLVRLQAL